MYRPPAHLEDDLDTIHGIIAATGLATLVTYGPGGLIGSHLPMLLSPDEGPFGTLHGHLARANTQWSDFDPATEALAIFTGPDAYITPSFYATKRETGKVVPTWNYAAVHAYGTLEVYHDPDRLLALVTRLTNHHERINADPWHVADAPPAFTASQLKGIVGVVLRITRVEGKRKLSQNRPEADRAGVRAGLRARGRADADELVDDPQPRPPPPHRE